MIYLSPEFISKLEKYRIVSKKMFQGRFKGEHRSPKRGTSIEFADYRVYQHGDDLRHVDWNIYARSDKLFVKLFTEEESLDISFLIDVSESMTFGEPSKLSYAKLITASLGYLGLANLDRVSVTTFSDSLIDQLKPLSDKRQIHKLVDFLEKIEPGGKTNLKSFFKEFGINSLGRKGVIVILSDFLDESGYQVPLKQLGTTNELHLIHVLNNEELIPSLEGEIRLEDSETGEAKEISVTSQILEEYHKQLKEFCQNLRSFCMRKTFPCKLRLRDGPSWLGDVYRRA